MRVVNLSSRPFLNRRPVARTARLLWVIGALLLALNVWLYTIYFSGTTKNRERLVELSGEIDAAENQLDAIGRRLKEVDLGGRNARAAYLNELIDQRTFPWSRLFDDLEEALPDDIYLTSVAPNVEKDKPNGRSSSRAQRPTRSRMTPKEAREKARQQREGKDTQMPTAESINVEESDDVAVVELELRGTARTEEALLDFVDALYENERFGEPFLSQENRDEKTRGIGFSITTFYLLPRAKPAAEMDSNAESDTEMATQTEPEIVGVAESSEAAKPSAQGPGNPLRSTETPSSPAQEGKAQTPERAGQRPRNSAAGGGRVDRTRLPIDGSTPADDTPAEGSPDRKPSNTKPPSPELTQPGASATPALRRVGSLGPPNPWQTSDLDRREAWA